MKKKQTAVQRFFMALQIRGLLPNEDFIEAYNQAKEMEKEQIKDAYNQGHNDYESKCYSPEQYYNETFKSE